MGYVATQPLRLGDQDLLPGDPVPADEPGRDYASMLHLGQIREASDEPAGSDSELRKQLKDAQARIKDLEQSWPEGSRLVMTLTDAQSKHLASLGVEGTVSLDDLDAALSSQAGEGEGDDAPLPDGVKETGGGWFQLADGTKVRGREAVDAALAETGS